MTDLDKEAEALLEIMRPTSPSAAPGQNMLPPQTRRDVPGLYAPSPVWRAGDGPATLFVHGWDDTHRVWRRFAQYFLQHQMPLLLMDLPGHGAAKADAFGWPHAGQSVLEVCAAEGPIDAIIAHSFGCIATARAIQCGAKADYLILIAPPMRYAVDGWAAQMRKKGAREEVIERAKEIHASRTGFSLDPPNLAEALQAYEGKILFIASDADEGSPPDLMRALAAQLPQAELFEVSGISHRDLALDKDVFARLLDFLGYE